MLKADIYLTGNDPLHQWAMKNRRRVSLGDLKASFAPPEYVILRKLQFHQEGGSEKHLRDINAMLLESASEIDGMMISQQSKLLGVEKTWQSLWSAESNHL